MPGIYLKCDACGATLGGEAVGSAERGPSWFQYSLLQDLARLRGWTGPLSRDSNSDRCPSCAKTEIGKTPMADQQQIDSIDG